MVSSPLPIISHSHPTLNPKPECTSILIIRSANFHLAPPTPSPPVFDIRHKFIQHPRPRPILAPPPHPLILEGLQHKHPRLIPHILTNTLLPIVFQILNPPIKPRRRSRIPLDGRAGEQEAPVFGCGVEGEDLLAGETCEDKGFLVNFLEEIGSHY